jgi:hypothetical protein
MRIFAWLRRKMEDRRPQPPSWIADLDPRSCEAIEWGLYATLMCQCDKCGTTLELPDYSEAPWNDDVQTWAKHFAPWVRERGWSMADDGFNLLCPKCREI